MANAESAEIRGRLAQEAKEMIDMDSFLEVFSKQMAGWTWSLKVRKWRAMTVQLAHHCVQDPDMLVRMQQYIATTPPEMRCPCTLGLVLNTTEDHIPEGDAVPTLELKARLLPEVDAEMIHLDLKRQRINHNFLDNRTTAEHLQAKWKPPP